LLLGVAWLVLLFATFRSPDAPKVPRLFFFQLLLLVSAILGYYFVVRVFEFNPNPLRVSMARNLTYDKTIYLGDIVAGLYDLDYIDRVDADGDGYEDWLAFYQYDVKENQETGEHRGPFGAAVYDTDGCRPPDILSYELVPVSYDYLGQDATKAIVENIIEYNDPQSVADGVALDRPELMINGLTRKVVTDLNIFRKTGAVPSCPDVRQWRAAHPGEPLPGQLRYENIGSFRGTYRVERSGSTVMVVDSAGFERSQFTVEKQYRPEYGTYFVPGTQVLLEPVEYSLNFGPGEPDDITQVYYPEKAVLAFYLALGKDRKNLDRAESYLSDAARELYDINRDPFGLSTAPDSVARARSKLARVLVWEIIYNPDVEAEQLHETHGQIDYAHPCQVTWSIIGVPNAGALPYGCEWRLDRYQSSCPSDG
jgi:hypothetical protein